MTHAHLFTVEAEADLQLPARILGLFTQRGLLPGWFSARCCKKGVGVNFPAEQAAEADLHARKFTPTPFLRIVVEIASLDDATCELLARKLLNIPTVLDVAQRRVGPRAAVVA